MPEKLKKGAQAKPGTLLVPEGLIIKPPVSAAALKTHTENDPEGAEEFVALIRAHCKPAAKRTRQRKQQTAGESIIQGLKEAIAWTRRENDNVRLTHVSKPHSNTFKN
ncbi:MAG: hypothetical protein ABSH09_16985 [Bryobacteraceae bacterium]